MVGGTLTQRAGSIHHIPHTSHFPQWVYFQDVRSARRLSQNLHLHWQCSGVLPYSASRRLLRPTSVRLAQIISAGMYHSAIGGRN